VDRFGHFWVLVVVVVVVVVLVVAWLFSVCGCVLGAGAEQKKQ
jgi:hypothetical protein